MADMARATAGVHGLSCALCGDTPDAGCISAVMQSRAIALCADCIERLYRFHFWTLVPEPVLAASWCPKWTLREHTQPTS